MSARKKVLVTGANGLLGSSLVPTLIAKGYDVVCVGFSSGADITIDLTDTAQTHGALDQVCPDSVVNLAALTDVDLCQTDPHQAYMLNIKIVENVASWVRYNESTELVQISTDQVYDAVGAQTEDQVYISNVYGMSKYTSELVAEGVNAISLRTNFLGKSLAQGKKSLSDWLVEKLLAKTDLTVFEDIYFSPLSLDTLSQTIATVLANPISGVYNLGSHGGLSKADVAFKLADVLGLDASHVRRGRCADLDLIAKRPSGMIMDSSKFEASYQVSLPTTIEEIESLRDVGYV